jgi:peptide-methionine (S)-S-oxide reductase
MFGFSSKKTLMPTAAEALAGRNTPIPTAEKHYVTARALQAPHPEGMQTAYFALGCYWGAERAFWQVPGVWVTAVGNMGGFTPNPTYEEVCSGLTGHAETVMVVFDPSKVSYAGLLKVFFEAHNPTQGMRQGNDVGTGYRSALFTLGEEQAAQARAAKATYEAALKAKGFGPITTEISPAGPFYFAETYHQQYLAKNPGGYCGLGGTGVFCPIGVSVSA